MEIQVSDPPYHFIETFLSSQMCKKVQFELADGTIGEGILYKTTLKRTVIIEVDGMKKEIPFTDIVSIKANYTYL